MTAKISNSAEKNMKISNTLNFLTASISPNLNIKREDIYQSSKIDSFFFNNRYNLITQNQSLLAHTYAEHGLIQALIDLPVDDAYRGGVEFTSEQLDIEDINKMKKYLNSRDIFTKVKEARRWARLFGGAGLIVNDGGPSNIDFIPVDRWEISINGGNVDDFETFLYHRDERTSGTTKDTSRVGRELKRSQIIIVKGKDSPYYIKQHIQRWGLSEVERLVKSFNDYLKNGNVLYELMDEAKIDVYRIKGFNIQ